MAVSHRSRQQCPACPIFRRGVQHTLPRSVQAGNIGLVLASLLPDTDPLRHFISSISIILLAGVEGEFQEQSIHLHARHILIVAFMQDDRRIDSMYSSCVVLGSLCSRPMFRKRAQGCLWRVDQPSDTRHPDSCSPHFRASQNVLGSMAQGRRDCNSCMRILVSKIPGVVDTDNCVGADLRGLLQDGLVCHRYNDRCVAHAVQSGARLRH